MRSIVKREKFRAQISLYKQGQLIQKEAMRWALENELVKGNGKQLAKRTTTFADCFENWMYVIKKMMRKR